MPQMKNLFVPKKRKIKPRKISQKHLKNQKRSLEALGIIDIDESDSKYDSSSESSYNYDDNSINYGDEESIDDQIYWVAYLEGIIDKNDVDKELEAGNKFFSLSDLGDFKKKEQVLMERGKQ